jgi:hypothetical protein
MSDNEQGEPTPTIAELISFVRACHDQVGTEGYSRPRFRALLAILEAHNKRRRNPPKGKFRR